MTIYIPRPAIVFLATFLLVWVVAIVASWIAWWSFISPADWEQGSRGLLLWISVPLSSYAAYQSWLEG